MGYLRQLHWRNWMLLYACMVHIGWSISLIIDPNPWTVTPMAMLNHLVPHATLHPLIYLVAAGAALTGIFVSARYAMLSITLILLQQFLMMMSAGGSMMAVIDGHYADLEPRPRHFIFRDQFPNIAATIAHSCAITDLFRRRIP